VVWSVGGMECGDVCVCVCVRLIGGWGGRDGRWGCGNVCACAVVVISSTTLPTHTPILDHQQQGDVRHAILTLQLQLALAPRTTTAAAAAAVKGSKGKGKGKGGRGGQQPPSVVSASLGAGEQEDKDRYLSGFHAIGKILYAKREWCC
jgi:hypothetical protein